MTTNGENSYIDYQTFLSPTFTPVSFANNLVTSTNNASDTTVDLTTPLSRVLFDVQEIDTHIDDLSTKSALPLLKHAKTQSVAAENVVKQVDGQIKALTESYQRLEIEVIERHAVAEEVRLAASRLWVTVKIGRAVSRALLLGRALEREMADATKGVPGKEDHSALIHAAYTLQTLRALFNATGRDEEGEHLSRINVLNTLRTDLLTPSEQKLKNRAQQMVREFSLSSLTQAGLVPSSTGASTNTNTSNAITPSSTSIQTQTSHETKSRTASALQTLYLLSTPTPSAETSSFTPQLLISALTTYLQTSLTSSVASLSRSLSSLPTLPRALAEVSARCQNIVALEQLLSTTAPTAKHPLLEAWNAHAHTAEPTNLINDQQSSHHKSTPSQTNTISTLTSTSTSTGPLMLSSPSTLLVPLLQSLDTSSLPSYFWRSLASALAPRVSEIIAKGGVAARSLKAAKDRVRQLLREAVVAGVEGARRGSAHADAASNGDGSGNAGSEGGLSGTGVAAPEMNWDREVAVFVGSVLGALGR